MAITRIRIEGDDADMDRLRGNFKWLAGEIAAAFDRQGVAVMFGHELYERRDDETPHARYQARLSLHPDVGNQAGFGDSPEDDPYVPNPTLSHNIVLDPGAGNQGAGN